MISYSVQPRGRLFLKIMDFYLMQKNKNKNKRVKILVKI